jgi:hypothetical protein
MTEWNIQPIPSWNGAAVEGFYAVYRTADTVPPEGFCGTDDLVVEDSLDGIREDDTAASGSIVKVTDIGLDADREFFQLNGSNVTNTINDMYLIVGRVAAIYVRDTNIKYEITEIIVRTSEPDPYSSTSPGTLLGQFRNWWNVNMGGTRYDVAHLFTGKNIDSSVIGIAYLSAICTSDRYGLSQSRYTTNIALRTSLTAHELGHNWSAQHCSGSDCRIMCPSNGGCTGDVSRFGNLAKSQISGFANTRNCLIEVKEPLDRPFYDPFLTNSLDTENWIYRDGVAVVDFANNEPTEPYSMNLDAFSSDPADQDQIRTNWIDLSLVTAATASFYTQNRGMEVGDSLIVEYFASNNRWNSLTTIVSNGVDENWFEPYHVLLPTFARHDEFRLRFTASVDGFIEDWFIDNVTATEKTIDVNMSPNAAGAPPGGFFTFDASVTDLTGASNSGEAWIDVYNADYSPWFATNPKFGPKSFGLQPSQTKNKSGVRINVPANKTPGSLGRVWAFVGDFTTGRIDAATSFTFLVQ